MKAARCLPFALILASCSPLVPPGSHELVLLLPPAPPAWACLPDLRFSVAYRGGGGVLRSEAAMPGTSLRIRVDRGRPQAILALPYSGGRALRPAGALYPAAVGGKEDELALDWRGGYSASLALTLAAAGVDPWVYDLDRLAAEALSRGGDPWLVPVLDAARRLYRAEFRIDAYEEPRRAEVSLPGPGPWAPESPFESLGADSTARLSPGLWRFLGPGGELFASVDAEGGATFVRTGG